LAPRHVRPRLQNYDYAGRPLTAARYEALVTSTYGTDAARVLAKYPVGNYATPGRAWTAVRNDDTATVRRTLMGQLSRYVPTYAYEFTENDTSRFASVHLLQRKDDTARAFPFGATHGRFRRRAPYGVLGGAEELNAAWPGATCPSGPRP
jgi:para-nitrobenzyl esterase